MDIALLFRAVVVIFIIYSIVSFFISKRKAQKRRKVVGYISALHTYPVKSAKPVSLSTAEITEFGVKHDRHFVVVNQHGRVLTMEKDPTLVLIRQHIKDDHIILEYDGVEPLKLSLNLKQEDGDHCHDITIIRKTTFGVHVSEEVDAWFSNVLGIEGCKLYSYPSDGTPRFSKDEGVKVKNYTNEKEMIMFANNCPLLVISEGTIDRLNEMIDPDVTIGHFRPTISISGCSAFAEETWGNIEINDIQLQALYPAPRCPNINVHPENGDVDKEIYKQLLRVRPANVDEYPLMKGRAMLGMYFGIRKQGSINVGDPVYEILD